jgi:hypothetical protein
MANHRAKWLVTRHRRRAQKRSLSEEESSTNRDGENIGDSA